jgi:uncharacterized protein with HEPN domain
MSKRSIESFLWDIIESMNAIEEYILGHTFEEFRNNRLLTQAVIRELEIIGEASKNIPSNIKSNYPDIPWKGMAGVRDKLIHGYFDVDYEIVWNLITLRIPETKSKIEKILREFEGRSEL